MSLWYPDLADYLAVAEEVIGIELVALIYSCRLPLAESALQGDCRMNRRQVPLSRLLANHPLPDGYNRAARVTMRPFIEVNGWRWRAGPPTSESEKVVFDVAGGQVDEEELHHWLSAYLEPGSRSDG